MINEMTLKGGKRKGAGRKPTGLAKTAIIQVRVHPKLKQKAIAKCSNLSAYVIELIEADLNQKKGGN